MKYYKYKMDLKFMNVSATIISIVFLVLHVLIFRSFDVDLEFFIYMFLWMGLHELIHGLAFMSFKEVKNKNVVFGAKLESGIFYCMCKQPISKKVILTALVSPLIFIGIITLIISIIFDLPTLSLLSVVNIGGCAGDILMTLMFAKLPKDIKYTDLDDCEGFVVLSEDNLEERKFKGLNLIEHGEYTKDIAPKDFTKLTCSKLSGIIFIILIVAFILSIIF